MASLTCRAGGRVASHFIDEVSLEMQLISDIENMMERIADSVYEKIRAADGDCDE